MPDRINIPVLKKTMLNNAQFSVTINLKKELSNVSQKFKHFAKCQNNEWGRHAAHGKCQEIELLKVTIFAILK